MEQVVRLCYVLEMAPVGFGDGLNVEHSRSPRWSHFFGLSIWKDGVGTCLQKEDCGRSRLVGNHQKLDSGHDNLRNLVDDQWDMWSRQLKFRGVMLKRAQCGIHQCMGYLRCKTWGESQGSEIGWEGLEVWAQGPEVLRWSEGEWGGGISKDWEGVASGVGRSLCSARQGGGEMGSSERGVTDCIKYC